MVSPLLRGNCAVVNPVSFMRLLDAIAPHGIRWGQVLVAQEFLGSSAFHQMGRRVSKK